MEIDNAKDYTKELNRLFDDFNNHYFDGALPDVFFTIVPTEKAYGHFTPKKVWVGKNPEDCKHEINISAYHFGRDPLEICSTLLHEMCHLYDYVNGIKDCSNNGRYHNKRFKKTAEDHGLICREEEPYGWCRTSLDEEAKKYCERLNIKTYKLHRENSKVKGSGPVKYFCPKCGKSSCFAGSPQKIICGYCNTLLIPDPKYRDRFPQFFETEKSPEG